MLAAAVRVLAKLVDDGTTGALDDSALLQEVVVVISRLRIKPNRKTLFFLPHTNAYACSAHLSESICAGTRDRVDGRKRCCNSQPLAESAIGRSRSFATIVTALSPQVSREVETNRD